MERVVKYYILSRGNPLIGQRIWQIWGICLPELCHKKTNKTVLPFFYRHW